MGIASLIKIIGSKTVSINKLLLDILFGAGLSSGKKIMRFFGIVNFLMTLAIAVFTGIKLGTTVPDKFLQIILELVKSVIMVDQYIFDISRDFSAVANPSLMLSVWTFVKIINKGFYLLWIHRAFCYLIQNYSWVFPLNIIFGRFIPKEEIKTIDQSTNQSKIAWWAFNMLYVFMVFSNIMYMIFISKEISFTFNSISGLQGKILFTTLFKNIFHFIDTILKHWWHFIVAFKGPIHYFIWSGNFAKTIGAFFGTKLTWDFTVNLTQNITQNLTTNLTG